MSILTHPEYTNDLINTMWGGRKRVSIINNENGM